jgi:hypothetical protein
MVCCNLMIAGTFMLDIMQVQYDIFFLYHLIETLL